MQYRSNYYLDAFIARDGTIAFHEVDEDVLHLCASSILTKYTFVGKRATVTVFSISECVLRWAALRAATSFMSGNYKTFNLVTMEWENGIEH